MFKEILINIFCNANRDKFFSVFELHSKTFQGLKVILKSAHPFLYWYHKEGL